MQQSITAREVFPRDYWVSKHWVCFENQGVCSSLSFVAKLTQTTPSEVNRISLHDCHLLRSRTFSEATQGQWFGHFSFRVTLACPFCRQTMRPVWIIDGMGRVVSSVSWDAASSSRRNSPHMRVANWHTRLRAKCFQVTRQPIIWTWNKWNAEHILLKTSRCCGVDLSFCWGLQAVIKIPGCVTRQRKHTESYSHTAQSSHKF